MAAPGATATEDGICGEALVRSELSPQSPHRLALLVLGMHRSGTSAVTRLLSLLGADLPNNLMPAIVGNNDAGFWESEDARHLNDEILASAGSRWDDWQSFDPGWVRSATKQPFKSRALDLLVRDFAASSLFVLKDPRICRMLPFWLEVLDDFHAATVCVLPIRNPLEVAASLEKRDGFCPNKSYVLWLRHVLDAELGSRGLPRAFVRYDRLLDDWRGAVATMSDQLGAPWRRLSDPIQAEIDRFLARRHRHHAIADDLILNSPSIGAWIKDAFAAVTTLEANPRSAEAQLRLDRVRDEFDRASAALGPAFKAEETARAELATRSEARIRELEHTVAQRNTRIGELQKFAIERGERIQQLDEAIAKRSSRIKILEEAADNRADRIKTLEEAADKRLERIGELQQALSASRQYVYELQEEADIREARIQKLHERLNTSKAREQSLAALKNKAIQRLDELQSSASWQLSAPLRAAEHRAPTVTRGVAAATKIGRWGLSLRLPRRLTLRHQVLTLLETGLFDRTWYLETYPDVALSGQNPIIHWLLVGCKEGKNPNRFFDAAWYLDQNPEAGANGLDALVHYIEIGAARAVDPHPLFNSAWYVTKNPDARTGGMTPLAHYLRVGARNNRQTRPVAVASIPGGRQMLPQAHRVLLCAHRASQPIFGGERSFLDLLRMLSDANFNVFVMLPELNDTYVDAVNRYAVEIAQLPYKFWRDDRDPEPDYLAAIEDYLRARGIDIVHVNTIMIREPLAAARRLGIPTITHVRESVVEDNWIAAAIGIPTRAIIERVITRTDYVIANSPQAAQEFHKDGATFLVPNAFDLDRLDIANSVNPRAIRIGLISSNIPKKGIEDFAALAKACAPIISNLEFLLIGPPNKHVKSLEARQKSGELPPSLKLVGYQRSPEAALRKVNLVANLSHFSETFGRTVAEGLAARRPAIVYDRGFPKNLVTEGETGFVLPFRNWKAAVPILEDLCRNPERIQAMGERGRAFIQRHYSRSTVSKALLEVYNSAFSRPTGSGDTVPDAFPAEGTALAEQARRQREQFEREAGPIEVLPARRLERPRSSEPDAPLRIAYFLWHFPVPSETFVLNELRLLVDAGHDLRVFCRASPHPEYSPDFPIEWETVADVQTLTRRLLETERQVVHAHFTYPTVTNMLWPAAEAAGVPFTFIAHAQDIFRYKNDENNRIGEIGKSGLCRRVFVPSRFHRDYVIERGVPPSKVQINPNGIDPSLYATGTLREAFRSRRSVCAVHRFTAKKGLDHLVRAAGLLSRERIDVALYGYGPDEDLLRALKEEVGAENVHFRGVVRDRTQLLEVFHQHDLFLCPAVRAPDGDMDGVPTVLMEAMAAGIPVMATEISGIPDLVREGYTGFTCGADPVNIADAIRRFYATPDVEIGALAAAAKAHIEDRFNAQKLTATLTDTWRNAPLDIVIVSWNNLPQLREVTERLFRHTRAPFHVTVCDNDSDGDVKAFLRALHKARDNVTIVFNSKNAGVGPGTNLAAAQGWGKYVVYVCGKEGFILSEGWDTAIARHMDNHPEVGLAGTLCTSPSYLTGSDYPKGIPPFTKFRNQPFASQNPARMFAHVQGGFFVMRRAMLDAIGGFNEAVPHDYTDVEFSFYAESCGYSLSEIPHLLSLYRKTRPDIWSRIDENVYAVHPPELKDLPELDRIAAATGARCNLCGWSGEPERISPYERICPDCNSKAVDRSLWRHLAASPLLHRRLPSLAIGPLGSLAEKWSEHFQGTVLDIPTFLQVFRRRPTTLELRTGGTAVVCIRCTTDLDAPILRRARSELARVSAPGCWLILQDVAEVPDRVPYRLVEIARELEDIFAALPKEVYRSKVVGYDPGPIIVARKPLSS